MSLTPEPLTLQRASLADDGSGGEVQTWSEVWTRAGTVNFFKRVTWLHLEEGAHNTLGPGTQNSQLRLLTFEAPYPSALPQVGNRFRRPDGSVWEVQNVRPYEDTLQVDVERIT